MTHLAQYIANDFGTLYKIGEENLVKAQSDYDAAKAEADKALADFFTAPPAEKDALDKAHSYKEGACSYYENALEYAKGWMACMDLVLKSLDSTVAYSVRKSLSEATA